MGKLHIQAMDDHCSKLLVCLLLMLTTTQVLSRDDLNNINITFIDSAVEKGAVCLDGSPPAYYYAPGFGDGANNWFVYMEGGAWCDTKDDCHERSRNWLGSSYSRMVPLATPMYFGGFLAQNPKTNPDFYNWNRIYIVYCDGSSFMGDVEKTDPETNVTYRGARVFKAVIDELLAKGMNNAQNAILSGSSAGGLATILNCDRFRQLVPHAIRLKCLADSGFFIQAKSLNGAVEREDYFTRVVKLHEMAKSLPESCASKMNPGLCLFPENLVRDIKTPLFILESAFDSHQIPEMLVPYVGGKDKWKNCLSNITLCSSTEIQIMKDFRTAFIEKLQEIEDIPSLGMFVHNCYRHAHMLDRAGWTCSFVVHNVLGNRTIGKAIGDWFFDRQCFKQIETSNDVPRNCTSTLGYQDFGKKCTDPVESAGWL